MDHVVPLARPNTSNDLWNLLPSCTFCNGMKKAAVGQRMRAMLMVGRYCLDRVRKRGKDALGAETYAMVEARIKYTKGLHKEILQKVKSKYLK